MTETWQILEPLAVRTTGFPIEILERLRTPHTLTIVRAILECEQEIERQRRLLLDEQFRSAVTLAHADPQGSKLLRQLSSWRRAIGRERLIEDVEMLPASLASFSAMLAHWNALLQKRETLYKEGTTIWNAEAAEACSLLREFAGDVRIQEAVFLSNPDMYQALRRYLAEDPGAVRTSAAHKFERRFFLYLQRFCAKNETQSFFGPINYGYLAPTQVENVRMRRSEAGLRQRVTFPSQWLAEALATKISEDPALRPFLRPRRGTSCLLRGHAFYFPATGKHLSVEAKTARLFTLADGHCTLEKLAAQLEEPWPTTWERIDSLRRRGVLTTDVLIPPDRAEPLLYLAEWLQEVPGDLARGCFWREIVHDLSAGIAALASANLEERHVLVERLEARFVEAIGGEARRGAGTMYADRFLFFEECLGDLDECSLGGALAQHVQQRLQPILHLAHAYAQLRAKHDLLMAKRVLERFAPTEGGVPLLAYFQSLAAEPPANIKDDSDGLELFLERLRTLVHTQSDGHIARLNSADLPIEDLAWDAENYHCTSLDLMLAAPSQASLAEGTFQLVLGEMHPYPLLWVFPTAYFAQEQNTCWQQMLIKELQHQPDSYQAAQFGFTRKTKIFPYQLPGPTIELRPRYPTCEAIPVAAVTIRESATGLYLDAEGQHVRLYTPITRRSSGLDPLAPLSFPALEPPPISLGAHTPRIEIDNVVYQRECWLVEGGLFGESTEKGFDLFLEVWRWKAQLGLPDEIFVRAAHEPKPVFIDFTCALSVELLATLARQSKQLTITEMWPDTRHLWLDGPDGRHTCEYRLIALKSGGIS